VTLELLFCFDYITVRNNVRAQALTANADISGVAGAGDPNRGARTSLDGECPIERAGTVSHDHRYGSQFLFYGAAVASLLKLNAEYRVLDRTPNGKRLTSGTRSVEVALGTRVAKNVTFLWQESRDLTEAGVEVDGVLGQSLLSRFDYLLDYKSGQLVLESPERQAADTRGKQIKFTRVAGRMLLTTMNPAEGSMRLILDSAASNVLLWRDGDYQVRGLTASLIAMNGRRVVNLIRMPLLVVGDQALQRLDVVVAPSLDEGREEDGLLPAELFRSIYVSNSETYVKLRQ